MSYNGDQVIEVNMTSMAPLVLEDATDKVAFTYSVKWTSSSTPFARRFDRYLEDNFFEHQIHWFSIFNSFMMVVFLVGLVFMILMRTLRNDYDKYTRDEDGEDGDLPDDSGWKQVHGDIFRAPPHLILLSALLGTGFQLVVLGMFVILFAIANTFYSKRGTMLTVGLFCYALTSVAGGLFSGAFYKQYKGQHWIKSMLLTAGLFPALCSAVGLGLNSVALAYGSLASVTPVTAMKVILLWVFVSFPLTLLGTLIGKNVCVYDFPLRVRPVPRPIPDKKWYMEPAIMILLGGILPFGSIFIEMYFIFTCFWHYKFYYVYGFMLLVYVILLTVSLCVTVVATYFLLNSEDYRWQWMSFMSSASTGVYIFLYSGYYYVDKTNMTGFFQACFYFGYVVILSMSIAILCGTVGYIGASVFVRRIYSNIKID